MANPEQFTPGGQASAVDYRIGRDDSVGNRRKYEIPPAQDGSIPTVQDTITVDAPNVHAVGGGVLLPQYPSTFDIEEMG